MEVGQFRQALRHVSGVRSEIRKSEKKLVDMTHTLESRQEGFGKFRKNLGEIQKKLILVDKMLFKGDADE